jgi:hypothetical protein
LFVKNIIIYKTNYLNFKSKDSLHFVDQGLSLRFQFFFNLFKDGVTLELWLRLLLVQVPGSVLGEVLETSARSIERN